MMRMAGTITTIGKKWSMPLCIAGLLNPSACMRMPLCAYIKIRVHKCDRQVRTIKLKKLRKGNQLRKKPANDSDKGGEAHIRLLIGCWCSFVPLSLSHMSRLRQRVSRAGSADVWHSPITQQNRHQRAHSETPECVHRLRRERRMFLGREQTLRHPSMLYEFNQPQCAGVTT
jgi:hypothetical protein